MFRGALDQSPRPDSVTLLTARPVDYQHSSRDGRREFDRVLAQELGRRLPVSLGHRQPVFAPSDSMAVVSHQGLSATVIQGGGVWRRFPVEYRGLDSGAALGLGARAVGSHLPAAGDSSLLLAGPERRSTADSDTESVSTEGSSSEDRVIADVALYGFNPDFGAPMTLLSSQIEATPWERDGRVIGVTFFTRHSPDLGWGQAAEPGPWPDNTFFIAAPGTAESAHVSSLLGRKMALDGANLARLLHDLRIFRSSVDTHRPEAFALLVSPVSDMDGQSKLARDLQATLSGEFGYREPVFGPSGIEGSPWRTFHLPTVLDDVQVLGVDAQTNEATTFRSSEAEVAPVEWDGLVIGAAFGADVSHGLNLVPDELLNSVFFIQAPSAPDRALIPLRNGTTAAIDGTNLGRLLHDLRIFRSSWDTRRLEAVTLMIPQRSDVDAQGGLAHDLQATLAGEFGYREPVIAPSAEMGRWQEYHLPTVLDDLPLSGVDQRTGMLTPFSSSEVVATPLERDGRVVGVTFAVGAERDFDVTWGRAEPASESYLFHGEFERARLSDDSARTVVPLPWPDRVFYVATHADQRRFVVQLADGTELGVAGGDFASLLGDLRFFQAAMRRDQPEAVALLCCQAAALDGPGGAAYDFRETLAQVSGYPQPVHAASTRLTASLLDQGDRGTAVTSVEYGGVWRRFPADQPTLHAVADLWRRIPGVMSNGRVEVVDGVRLSGTDQATGGNLWFDSSQVQAYRLQTQDGTTVGVTFHVGEDLWSDRGNIRFPHDERTALYPAGVRTVEDMAIAERAGTVRTAPVPWPSNTFYVTTHGSIGTVTLTLDDGRPVFADGANLGRLLHDLRPFRETVAGRDVAAITLIACETGAYDGPGGAAHDFQRALGQLGSRRPVFAPTKLAGSVVRDSRWLNSVLDGGDWRVLGQVVAPTRPPVGLALLTSGSP